jgi:RNA polymerase sigma-70 factor (ECF subfamily)
MASEPTTARRTAGEASDKELLERFAATRAECVFAALVQRHGAAVLRVCRGVLASEQDAEEVVQATFLTLARKAGAVPWRESVRHWLLAVARRLALQARCTANRRNRLLPISDGADLSRACDAHDDPLAEVARRELRLVIDEELGRLPEKYRAPVVLCYLEGKTHEQAAGELGWPLGSMSRRLARGRALLRDRLSRRGLALVVIVCLALTWLWLVRSMLPHRGPRVAAVMASLKDDGREGFEKTLLRVAEGGSEDRDRLDQIARRAARAADVLQGHAPGHSRPQWRRLAEQMRVSSLDLAQALAHNDELRIQAVARQLAGTCQTCHATFRE